MPSRVCEQCGTSIDNRRADARTCGAVCRLRLSRRLRSERDHALAAELANLLAYNGNPTVRRASARLATDKSNPVPTYLRTAAENVVKDEQEQRP